MRVLLVGPDLEENLSLRFLSAALKKAGHESSIGTFDSADDINAVRTAAKTADMVALSLCYQIRAPEFLALARALKVDAPARPVIVGGHYASCAASELLENHEELDLIVIHEGERAIVELVELERLTPDRLRCVAGIVFRDAGKTVATEPREIVSDLDSLPWADRTGPGRLVAGVPTAYLMGSRGCVGNCDYCCISTLHRLVPGKRFRQRTPENIVAEMAWLYHDRGVRQFVFHDDNFLVPSVDHNLKRISALDRALRREGLRHIGLVLKCRPPDVNEEVFRRLREIGLLRVFLGIESGSAVGLESIGRRQQTVADAHRALQIVEDLEISTQYTMIMVHPEATAETMLADLAFVRAHPAHPMSYCRAQIYAGTPLEQRMIALGRARGDYLARTYDFSDSVTACTWKVGHELFWERCFSQTHLQGQVVRLDHLMAAARHFYVGREIDTVVGAFMRCEEEVNRETVDLFEELISLCREHPDPTSAALLSAVAELAERERVNREDFQGQICRFREKLVRITREMVGLPTKTPSPSARPLRGVARHAAATLIAVGLVGCSTDDPGPSIGDALEADTWVDDTGIFEAPPMDMGGDRTDDFVDDFGVFEAPPMDMGRDATDGDDDFVEDWGVFEAPPMDMGSDPSDATDITDATDTIDDADTADDADTEGDDGWVDDHGVFEAPPMDM